jgi:hypothetical protein
MNERWKYQIRTGLPFGIIMPIVIISFDWLFQLEREKKE